MTLLPELRVLVQPHGLVAEVAVEGEQVSEMRVEGEPARRDEPYEPALAEREDVLGADVVPVENDDLRVGRAVRVGHAADNADEGMREERLAARRSPRGGVAPCTAASAANA